MLIHIAHRTASTVVLFLLCAIIPQIFSAIISNSAVMAQTPTASPLPALCPTPIVGDMRGVPPIAQPEERLFIYIDRVSSTSPVTYTWRTTPNEGTIVDGQGTSAILYQAPNSAGIYGITANLASCNFYQEMSASFIVSGTSILNNGNLTPMPTAVSLACQETRRVAIFPHQPSSQLLTCARGNAWGSVEYCESASEQFIAHVDLNALNPNTGYLLSLQAADDIPQEQETNSLLLQSCGENTPRGDGYCDMALPVTGADGNLQATVSKQLEQGSYEVKLLLKDASSDDYCVAMFSPGPHPFAVKPSTIQKGITFVTWQKGDYQEEESDNALKALAATGANWVGILVTGYQENISTTSIDLDENKSPTDEDLHHVIAKAKSLGLRVMLKPHVDLLADDSGWRGQIGEGFSDAEWQAWFTSYQDFIFHYAALAKENQVDLLAIGTELVTTSEREAEWQQIVAGVRERFDGEITYAGNWDEPPRNWWSELDYIGVDAYFPLSTNNTTPTVAELKEAWIPHLQQLADLHKEIGIPIILTEIGYRSIRGAHSEPAQWQQDAMVDMDEQANLYQAALETFCGREWVNGIYWWNWLAGADQSNSIEKDYTPHNKPAAAVLTTYYRDGLCDRPITYIEPLIPFTNNEDSCPVAGASGEVEYVGIQDGKFQATVRTEGLKPNHGYLFTINCQDTSSATCKLLANECTEADGTSYCDLGLGATDEEGILEATIAQELPSGEYDIKFFIKDPGAGYCIPLHNSLPEPFVVR